VTNTARIWTLLALTAVLAASAVPAADEAMPGRVTIIKPGLLAKMVAKPATGQSFDLPAASSDPTIGGARLRVVEIGGSAANDVVYNLPPSGWKALGSGGFKYKGAGSPTDPCKTVLVKASVVKAICRGEGVTTAPPLTGALGFALSVGEEVQSYCSVFGGSEVTNTSSLVKRKSAPAPACTCGAGPPSELSFASGVGAGVCGTVTNVNGMTVKDLNCGELVIGGGSSPVPPGVWQDMVHPSRLNVDCCTGDTLLLGQTTQAMTGSQRECTAPGCLFGPPLPIVIAPTPQSACVYLVVTKGGTGTAQCDTGDVIVDMEILGAMFLTGDMLPSRCSGGSNPGGRCTCIGGICPSVDPDNCPDGGICVDDPDVQPCPICNPTTLVCNGGQDNGLPCEPGSQQVVGAPFPTSHDCSVSTLVKLGDIFIPFHLSTGTTEKTAFDSASMLNVFCGFCRDAETGAFEEVSPTIPRPCDSDADCAEPFESCMQRSSGAFGPNGGAFRTATEIGMPAGNLEDYAPHTGTLAGIFCIPPTFLPLIDASSDLPGPGAVSFAGATIQLTPP